MKRDNYPRLMKLILPMGVLATLAACQNSGSHFAERSQATMVLDTNPGSSGQNGLAQEGSGMPEGLGRFGGHYYYIRNGTAVRLFQRQHFLQGYYYDGGGRIVSGSGQPIRLAPGEMVTFSGERLPVPPAIAYQ
jgi:hypothetical protein